MPPRTLLFRNDVHDHDRLRSVEPRIVLGSGGDCCYSNNSVSQGTYEGAIVSGYPSDATDDAIQANIVNAGYGK